MTTLDEAKAQLAEGMESGGTNCPCCGQYAKLYRRHIYSTMARGLILHYQESPTEFVHVRSLLKYAGFTPNADHALLRYWGLIEPEYATRPDGSGRNGWWRVTQRGSAFVLGLVTVEKYALLFDGHCFGFEGGPWSIHDALEKGGFDYAELMAA